MKRILGLVLILIVLGGAAYFIKENVKSPKSSIDTTDRQFAFPKEDVGKILITEKDGNTITYTRRGNDWYINDTYKVSEFIMPHLLNVIDRIKINTIPSNAAKPNLIDEINRIGFNVKVYDLQGKEVKSYYVGSDNKDGTTFLMDGAEQPYNVHLKAITGGIRSRFLNNVDEVRDREIFKYNANDIKSIVIEYYKDQKASFKLNNDGKNIEVEPLSQFLSKSTTPVNQALAQSYLSEYNRLFAEAYDNGNARKDSISQLIPFARVTVSSKSGDSKFVDFYPFKDLLIRNANTETVQDAQNLERYFVNKNDEDFLVVQNRVFNPIFRPYEYFFLK